MVINLMGGSDDKGKLNQFAHWANHNINLYKHQQQMALLAV